MYLTEEPPLDYTPFEELVICGNAFINGQIPLEMNGHFPFLVGKGLGHDVWVWLSMPATQQMKEWRSLVKKNVSINKLITVDTNTNGTVKILARGQLVILVTRENETKANIRNLDLRPIGLRVFGDANGLTMGTNSFVGNTFSNVGTMLSVAGY